MKRFTYLLLLLWHGSAEAQVIITSADMPQKGEQFIYSFANPLTTIDLEFTGEAVEWDFSNLQRISTVGDTFIDASDLPSGLSWFFLFSELAHKLDPLNVLGGLSFDEAYRVFSLSSTKMEVDGFALIASGFPWPLVLNPKDVWYRFPMQFGNQDSSDSHFVLDVPSLLYYRQQRHRVNVVDGWGTVVTPIGTFQCLRLKSTITDQDSISLPSYGYGFSYVLRTVEYKWLVPGMGVPVVQVTAQDIAGYPVITQIVYQDTTFHIGMANLPDPVGVTVFPNPAVEQVVVHCTSTCGEINVFDVRGRRVWQATEEGSHTIAVSDWPSGIYWLRARTPQGTVVRKFVVQANR